MLSHSAEKLLEQTMKSQKKQNKKVDDLNHYSSKYFLGNDCTDRHQQEMKRRLSILRSRRVNLERELTIVKACLSSLGQQIESHAAYKRLSMKHQQASTMHKI